MVPSGRKVGVAAFLFFLVKGLLWLIIPFLIYESGCWASRSG
jgi:hypothetical protein